MEKKYYKYLDIIRVVACIGVLLYHLGYLKGGFLSVCLFFVLSGYLSFISLSRTNKVSLKDYYLKRIKHIYLPLLFVVFISICFISFVPNIHWFQLKPETTSVILGFNNYWQLSVNADYFARHISSPFMHLWYLGILLQFELIFPFVFILFKKIKEKNNKIPIVLLVIIILGSISYFVYNSLNNNIMFSYYDTLCRLFSLFLGILIGYIHINFKPIKFNNNYIFWVYIIIFILLQFITDSSSIIYCPMMILVSFISCRLIDYSIIDNSDNLNFWERETKYLSNVSYEVYLFQYPVIFIFQYLIVPEEWKLTIMILLIFGLSYLLHFVLDFKNKEKKYIRFALSIVLVIFSLYGVIQFVNAKDYTEEMNDLKKQLSMNEKLSIEKQKDFEEKLKIEKDEWNKVLNDLESGEANLSNYVTNLPIVAVGDSVMLGAVPTLYSTFPNGYFDAAVSRTDYEANSILLGIKNQGNLPDNIIIHLGTNGQCGLACQKEIMNTCENRNVFYVTVSNEYDVHVNNSFYKLSELYPNVHIIDWYNTSLGHPEYFAADGIHLTRIGMNVYSETIYNGIYNYYYKQIEDKKNKLLKEHDELLDTKVMFYGDDILLNIYNQLQNEYPDGGFRIQQDFSNEELLKNINEDLSNKTISKKVVIVANLKKDNITKINNLLKDYEVYMIDYSNFSSDSYMVDGRHLNDKGNKELLNKIKESINKKD